MDSEDFMDSKDMEYFRKLLSDMLEEAQQNGDLTIEELTDSNEVLPILPTAQPRNPTGPLPCVCATGNCRLIRKDSGRSQTYG